MTRYIDTVPARPHAIMFHHLHDDATHGRRQGSISPGTFEALLDHVEASASLLSADTWAERAAAGMLGTHDVCLTFDDGLRCQLDLAVPALARRGVRAFFFVYSSVLDGALDRLEVYAHFRHTCFASIDAFYTAFEQAVGASEHGPRVHDALGDFDSASYLPHAPFYSPADRRFRYVRDHVLGPEAYHAVMDAMIGDRIPDRAALVERLSMSADDVRRLHAAGHVIGLHSHSHPTDMAGLDHADQQHEFATCQQRLEILLGTPPTSVAHPCGRYDDRTLAILRGLGVTLGFRADFALESGSALEHPRQDHANVVRSLKTAVDADPVATVVAGP